MAMEKNSSEAYDIIVIGVGGVGSFALRALANRPVNVENHAKKPLRILGIEQFVPGHGFGSSHGKSRIYRHAYFEHPSYVPLTRYSSGEFFSLQKKYVDDEGRPSKEVNAEEADISNLPFIQSCGTLVVDYSVPGDSSSVVQRCIDSAHEHNVHIQEMDCQALREKYPQFRIEEGMRGVLEPDAGMVCPERAIGYALEDARRMAKRNGHKLEILTQTEVLRIFPEGPGGEAATETVIETRPFGQKKTKSDSTCFKSSNIIITAGAWTSKLVPQLKSYLKVTRQVQGWIDVSSSKKAIETMTNSPAWFVDRGLGHLPMYGIPCNRWDEEKRFQTRHKVALHHRPSEVTDPYKNSQISVTKEEEMELEIAARDWLQGDALPSFSQSDNRARDKESFFVESLPCMYTTTTDEHFIIDSISSNKKEQNKIWFVAGLSGHGFKMVPALAKAVADLAMDGHSNELPVDFLRMDRLSRGSNN